jgi:tripartite-type tricarboxylate transporter receptor subunit TctC
MGMFRHVATLVLGVAMSSAALSQNYPDRPVRIVVGFSAGGPTDIPARFIADRLGTALGQRFIVENRTGAGGQIATMDVLGKPRDGSSLLLCTHFEGINLALYKAAQYKLTDLAPISQIARYYYGLAVTNEIPASTWSQFIAYARANPGKVNYGSVGRGSAQELIALEIGKMTGTTLTGVPYKGGADIMNDLISGRIHLYVSPTLAILPQLKAGKLRIIGVSSAERLAVAPDLPTVTESGLPLVRFGWLGFCGAAGTPQPIVALLNRQINAIVKAPDYRDMIEKAGSVPLGSTPEELAKILVDTYEQTAGIVREFNLQLD